MFVVCFIFLCLPIIPGLFIPQPTHPKINENVFLTCLLNAPDGNRFTSTVPSLKINGSLYSFSFDDITIKLNDSRYHGLHLPDLNNRRNLRGDISIFYVREEDFAITFTCIAQLENDTFIEHTLKLNTTQPDTPILECTPLNTMPNDIHISDPTISPQNEEEFSIWKALYETFTPSTIVIIIILGSIIGVPNLVILFRYLWNKYSHKKRIADFH